MQVQRDFEELPAEAASALRDSLVELLLRYAAGSAPVRTQLCLAIAALAAHMPPQRWAPAGSAVAWLVQRLTKEPEQAALPCLLELLTVLPQVCSPGACVNMRCMRMRSGLMHKYGHGIYG